MVIKAIEEIVALLAQEKLSATDVIDLIGAANHDYNSNVLITPRNPQFSEANLVREIDLETFLPVDKPSHVVLTLSTPVEIELMVRAFGDYDHFEAAENIPAQLYFYPDTPGQSISVALISAIDNARIGKITIRRDEIY